jgi:hypothetical protein
MKSSNEKTALHMGILAFTLFGVTTMSEYKSDERGRLRTTAKSFRIEGFGDVGEGNLLHSGFAVTSGPDWRDLEIGQSCSGITTVGKPEALRVSRLR